MRLLGAATLTLVLVPALLLAGCVEDPPAPEPAAEPEEACDARGLTDASCGAFCSLQAAACGLPVPTPPPYPSLPVPPGAPAPNGTASGLPLAEVCPLLPGDAACPRV